MQTDRHQHLWTEPLIDALDPRDTHPFVERTRKGLTVLHATGALCAPTAIARAA